MTELSVPREHTRSRLDRYLASALPEFSRARLQEWIRAGFVRLNGVIARPRDAVRTGDIVTVQPPPIEKLDTRAEEIPLQILHEDEDLLAVDKPAGLVVHPGAGNREHTLVNALLAHCTNLSGIGGKERPGIVHRLDKETSGCIVIAKNDRAHQALTKQFAARAVRKVYLALVAGKFRLTSGVIDAPIARHPVHRQRMSVAKSGGREARTEYRVLRSGEEISLVECSPQSGRTHQIRVHLHHLGHPLLGDKVYAPQHAAGYSRQMLHAWKLAFSHPRNGEWCEFESPLPEDFRRALESGFPRREQNNRS